MKKIFLKILILFFIIVTFFISNNSLAEQSLGLGNLGQYAQQQEASTKFTEKVDVVLGVVQMIGSLISVICLIVLGIKYMMGSVEEKATYKKTLMPYALGAFMVLGISNFVNLIYKIATGVF